MTPTSTTPEAAPLVLRACTAADLMTPNPISISANARVAEAVAFLTGRGFTTAPVIDEAGRPVGVLSASDLLIHQQHWHPQTAGSALEEDDTGLTLDTEQSARAAPNEDPTTVRDLMTPVVLSVTPEATSRRVVDDLLQLKVHHLFVVDANGVLIGVISTGDVLRALLPAASAPPDSPRSATR